MKSILFVAFAFLAANSSFAAENGAPSNVEIRCEGLNKKGVKIGIDVELDPVDRIVSLTTFEADSSAVIDIKELASPSHYFRGGKGGKLEVFGFKTFNDGLEEAMSVLYVAGSSKLSSLKLGSEAAANAVKQISCRVLK